MVFRIILGSLSIIFCLVGIVIKNDFGKIVERGFFDGYTAVVWFVILLQVRFKSSLFICIQNNEQNEPIGRRWFGISSNY